MDCETPAVAAASAGTRLLAQWATPGLELLLVVPPLWLSLLPVILGEPVARDDALTCGECTSGSDLRLPSPLGGLVLLLLAVGVL